MFFNLHYQGFDYLPLVRDLPFITQFYRCMISDHLQHSRTCLNSKSRHDLLYDCEPLTVYLGKLLESLQINILSHLAGNILIDSKVSNFCLLIITFGVKQVIL